MAGVQPSKFVNYISQFKKLLVTRNNGAITQKFKVDSNISDDYYFSIVNSRNQLIDLTGRTFKIYGSLIDAKEQMHVLFYSDAAEISTNGLEMHFNINTYTSQYMNLIKSNKIIDLTIIEVTDTNDNNSTEGGGQGDPDDEDLTQVILRDEAIAYKRPYIENQTPAEILQRVILTTNVPLTGVFGSGQDINLTMGSNGAAFGTGLEQTGNNQLVIGKYNEVDNTKAFIIGNGNDDTNRSNILTVDYQGNIRANNLDVASAITVNGSPVATDSTTENKLNAMSSWVDDTFETKANATSNYNSLANYIGVVSSAIPTRVGQLTNDAGYLTSVPSEYVTETELANATANYITINDVPVYTGGTGISVDSNHVIALTGEVGKTYYADDVTLQLNNSNNQFSIKSIASKLNQGANIILTPQSDGSVTINAVGGSGGAGGSIYLAGLGLGLSTVSAEDGIYKFYVNQSWLDGKIEAVASSIQTLSAGTGLKIEDDIISLTATIPSIDGLASEEWVETNFLSAIPSNYATKDYVDSSVSGKADLSSVYTKEEVYTYIETDAKINEATSGKADKTELTGLASKQYVEDYTSAFITVDDIPTSYVQEDQLTAYATKSDISDMATQTWVGEQGYLTEVPSDYATSAWVDQNYAKVGDVPTDVYTKTEVDAISSAISTAVVDAGYLTEIPTSYVERTELTAYATKDEVEAVSGELVNAIGAKADATALQDYVQISSMSAYATSAWVDETFMKIGDVPTDVYTKTEVNEISTALSTAVSDAGYLTEVPNTYALKTDVDTASAAAVNVATGWVDSQGYLTEHQSLDDYATKAELTDYATQADLQIVSAAIPTDYLTSSDIDDMATQTWVTEQGYLTAHQSLDDYYNKTEANAISTALSATVSGAGYLTEHQSLDDYATKTLVGEVSGTITGQVNDLATGAVATNTTNIGLVSGKVETIEADYLKAADIADMATTGYVTGQVNALANGAVATNTANISQLSTDLGTVSGKANTNETNIGLVSSDLGTLSGELNTASTFISGKVNALSGQVNTASSTLTAQTNYLSGQIDTNATNIGLVDGRVQAIEADYTTSAYVTGKVNDLANGAVATNTSNITQLSTDLGTATGNITTLSTDLGTVSGKIDTVSGNIITVSGDVETIKSDYVTSATLTSYVNTNFIAVSQLVNDVGYITAADVPGGGGGGGITSAEVSAIVEGYNYLSSITVDVYDQIEGDYVQAQVIELQFNNDTFYVYSDNNVLYVDSRGIKFKDSESNEYMQWEADFSSDFAISEGDGYVTISLANPIPTAVSDLTNDAGYQTAAQVSAIASGYAGTGGITSAEVSAIITGYNYLSSISVSYTDESSQQSYSYNVSGIEFMDWAWDIFTNNSIAQVYWRGLKFVDSQSNEYVEKQTHWSSDFTINGGDGYIEVSLANPIPTNVSDLTNDAGYATSAQVSAIASGYAGGGGGASYTAGSGIVIDNGVIATNLIAGSNVTFSVSNNAVTINATGGGGGGGSSLTGVSELANDTGFITASDITNKQRVYDTNGSQITYDPTYEIFKTTYTVTSDAITLNAVAFDDYSVANGQVATFEEWLYTTDSFTTVNLGSNILIGDLPDSFTAATYHVFVRRLVNVGGTITQYVSFAYEVPVSE